MSNQGLIQPAKSPRAERAKIEFGWLGRVNIFQPAPLHPVVCHVVCTVLAKLVPACVLPAARLLYA